MKQISLSKDFSVSPIIHGQMRINDWHLSSDGLLSQMKRLKEWGIDTFDNADIYGNYTCENNRKETNGMVTRLSYLCNRID